MSDDEQQEIALVMPFVVCTSKGGPFDDEAFTAGWECGGIDAALTLCSGIGGVLLNRWVRSENLPQLDLIAMRHQMALTVNDSSEGWLHITIAPGGGE